jgi:hypothetical protein
MNSLNNKTVSASFAVVSAKYFQINTKDMNRIEISEIELCAEPIVGSWEMKAAFVSQCEHGGENQFTVCRFIYSSVIA